MNSAPPSFTGPFPSCRDIPGLRGGLLSRLRVAAFEPRSLVNGPGARAVLWVQGCGRRCPGCFNPEFLPIEGGLNVTTDEVARWIEEAGRSENGPIDGVTFSGGEPFDQALALAVVARSVRERGLGVLVFTGHPWADLKSGSGPGWTELVAASDLLVAGPYQRESAGAHPLLASGNQELIHVTSRYRNCVGTGVRRRVEFRIGADGDARVSGFPSGQLRRANAPEAGPIAAYPQAVGYQKLVENWQCHFQNATHDD